MKSKIDENKYSWYRDKKMIGTILLIAISIMQVFAFLKVPVVSSIHGYTIGMLFGFYNPLFYLFVWYFALKMVFKEKVKLPKWVKLNPITYWFVAISIIFISTSTFHYQTSTGFTSIGAKPWNAFPAWFDDFTSRTAWAPAQTNGGLIGVFLYSISASIISGIGSLILSITLLILTISLIITGSFIGLYKNLKNKHVLEQKKKDDEEDKKMNLDSFIEPDKTPQNTAENPQSTQDKKEEPKPEKSVDLPFEDPFA